MRVVLVAGAQDWPDSDSRIVWGALSVQVRERGPFVMVHGGDAAGVDALAHQWLSLEDHYCDLPCCDPEVQQSMRGAEETYPLVRGDGDSIAMRNQRMVDRGADLCLAFITPSSTSAVDCMTRARIAGIPVIEHHPETRVVATTHRTLYCSGCQHPALDHEKERCDAYGPYDDCTCAGYAVDLADLS